MSILQIGKGETKDLIYQLDDKDKIFNLEDKLLYALKDKNENIVYTKEALIKDIPIEDELYIFNVELSSDLTKTFEIGSCKYSYDLTLLQDEKKIPLSEVMHFDIVETVGASISEG